MALKHPGNKRFKFKLFFEEHCARGRCAMVFPSRRNAALEVVMPAYAAAVFAIKVTA
jgi:hypothetical protein